MGWGIVRRMSLLWFSGQSRVMVAYSLLLNWQQS